MSDGCGRETMDMLDGFGRWILLGGCKWWIFRMMNNRVVNERRRVCWMVIDDRRRICWMVVDDKRWICWAMDDRYVGWL
ncbi:3227_t:CDS:2 [Cetraspora pellucida]|uniref:3227_t:CDS:1 n=1 Tax=Cetraspora pellucida TaxID=1433469 RepID=A0A9N9JZS2_9GLOM|nr:3227_t:CDS:2 [Cetraspora pellucida]